jgi:hypothetical protein
LPAAGDPPKHPASPPADEHSTSANVNSRFPIGVKGGVPANGNEKLEMDEPREHYRGRHRLPHR